MKVCGLKLHPWLFTIGQKNILASITNTLLRMLSVALFEDPQAQICLIPLSVLFLQQTFLIRDSMLGFSQEQLPHSYIHLVQLPCLGP